jgi:hypothetical protein
MAAKDKSAYTGIFVVYKPKSKSYKHPAKQDAKNLHEI